MYCSNCGNPIQYEDSYCPSCGIKCQNKEKINPAPKGNENNISLITGIISFIFCWIPIISIPLAISAILLGRKYKKETGEKTAGSILGIISLVFSTLGFIFIFMIAVLFFNILDEETDNTQMLTDYLEQYEYYETEISFDISGYSWVGNDKSVIYLNKNKKYSWYQDDKNQTDNFYNGTYEYYTGTDAINYISTYLREYGVTEEEQKNLIERGEYQLKNYYLLILTCDKVVINGVEERPQNSIVYYYGFYNEKYKRLELVNMDTANKGVFTLRGKISNIDI